MGGQGTRSVHLLPGRGIGRLGGREQGRPRGQRRAVQYTLEQVKLVGQRELNAEQTPVRIIAEDVVGRFLLARNTPSGTVRVNDPKGAAGMAEPRTPSANASSTVKKLGPVTVPGTTNSEGEFLRLFNGKDTSGWKLVGNAKHSWSVSGGLLECSAGALPSSILTTAAPTSRTFTSGSK